MIITTTLTHEKAVEKYGEKLYNSSDIHKQRIIPMDFFYSARSAGFFEGRIVKCLNSKNAQIEYYLESAVSELKREYIERKQVHNSLFNNNDFDYLNRYFSVNKVKSETLKKELINQIGEENILNIPSLTHYSKTTSFVRRSRTTSIKYLTIHAMSAHLSFNIKTLNKAKNNKAIPRPSILEGTCLFDVEWVEKNKQLLIDKLDAIAEVNRQKAIQEYGTRSILRFFSVIDWIDAYTEKIGSSSFNYGQKEFKQIKEHRTPEIKRAITKLIYDIIVYREELFDVPIKVNKHTDPKIIDRLLLMDKEFDVTSISVKDKDALLRTRTEASLASMRSILEGFLSFVLLKLRTDEYPDYSKIKERFEMLLEQIPKKSKFKKTKRQRNREKVYLKRSQIITIFDRLRKNSKFGKRYALMWMIGFFLGIRPQELNILRIEYFELDKNGFLRADPNSGYGTLLLPEEGTKGKYSPSHPEGMPVVPLLVKLINEYLKDFLYKIDKENIGYGYLFRHVNNPKKQLSRFYTHGYWISALKPLITDINIKNLKHLQLKTTRHSLYTIIMNTPITNPSIFNFKEMAATEHMRHNGSETVANEHYLGDIEYSMYETVIDETLNFPWDLKELKKWEIEKGYIEDDTIVESDKELNFKIMETEMKIRDLEIDINISASKLDINNPQSLKYQSEKEKDLRNLKKELSSFKKNLNGGNL